MLALYPHRALSVRQQCALHSVTLTAHRHEGMSVTHSGPRSACSLIGLVALLAGCAPIQPVVINEPIGPMQQIVDDSRPLGSLTVYSDVHPAPSDQPFDTPHSDYLLYTAEDRLLQTVNNRKSLFSSDPVSLELPVGRYKVTARAANVGLVSVPVVIQQGLTTVVDLNQEVFPRRLAANGDWVRLPTGQVIGSKSE